MTLINRGAKVNYQTKVAIYCTLCSCGMATIIDHCAFTTLLQSGWTPLHYACDKGRAEVVKILIKHGAQLDFKDEVHKFIMCGELLYQVKSDLMNKGINDSIAFAL